MQSLLSDFAVFIAGDIAFPRHFLVQHHLHLNIAPVVGRRHTLDLFKAKFSIQAARTLSAKSPAAAAMVILTGLWATPIGPLAGY